MQVEWNERFSGQTYAYGTKPNDFLVANAHLLKPHAQVLCIAEGEGRNGVFLSQQGHQVSAFDFSTEGRKKAMRLAKEKGVSMDYAIYDINEYDFGKEKWDAVVSIFVHSPKKTSLAIWKKVADSLKDGGLFILESYHPRQLEDSYQSGGPDDRERLVSLSDLNPPFRNFEVLHEKEIERDVSEGIFHTGRAFVTQFICKRH